MSRRVEILYTLQRIDTRIMSRKHRYDQVKAALGESEALIQARARRETVQAELKQWRIALRDLELEGASITAKQKETEDRLYGGRVRDPKELSDLQKESQYLKRRMAALEESQLTAMMKVEEWTAQAAIANEEYTIVEGAWRSENAQLGQEYGELKQELSELLPRRQAFVKKVPERDMEEYESIRKVRQGIAITVAIDGSCQICHVQVPTNLLDKARDSNELVYCSGCDRILYMPSE